MINPRRDHALGTDHAAIKNCAIFTLGVHFAAVINVILAGICESP